MTAETNPLLDTSGLPRFREIQAEHVVPGVRAVLSELASDLERAESEMEPTWDRIVPPLERIEERLSRVWGVVGHLMGVRNSDELRAAHEEVQGEVVAFSLRVGQSPSVYKALKGLRDGAEWGGLSGVQKRIVDCLLRDAQLAGVGLDGADQTRFNEIQASLAESATTFANHVLDATKAFSLTLTEKEEVEGLPLSYLALAAQLAAAAGAENATAEAGPWRITLDFPSMGPFLQHSARRDLRERVYRASITRASSGDNDNQDLIRTILALRGEQARLLGYADFAEQSLAAKMAPDVGSVLSMLEELRQASYQSAESDLDELRALARERGAVEADDLRPWDVGYWAERLRESRFDYSDEELRPYFPLDRVLDGLFALTKRLFGVTVVSGDGTAPVWHDDIRFFRLQDESGADLAAFYLDAYSRPAEKRGGAWMDECVTRAEGRVPVAYLCCNQSPPVGDKPSEMSFREVETLFHEFGHGLQHMLTTVGHPMAAGIHNVEWDAVELPSQFMENWCYHRETLLGLSKHTATGEALPDDLFEKLKASRTFRSGSDMLRQLFFGFLDLALHRDFDPAGDKTPFELQAEIAERTTVLAPIAEDRFLCAFTHIFAGGYAAGYYSYKWAEVLSADAFSAFEEVGLDDGEAVAETGRRFRDTVLSQGGSRHPMEVFETFRGRPPQTAALLRHAGLG